MNSIISEINLQFESFVTNGIEMNLNQIVNIVDAEVEDVDITQEQTLQQSQEQETDQ